MCQFIVLKAVAEIAKSSAQADTVDPQANQAPNPNSLGTLLPSSLLRPLQGVAGHGVSSSWRCGSAISAATPALHCATKECVGSLACRLCKGFGVALYPADSALHTRLWAPSSLPVCSMSKSEASASA